MEKEKTIEGFQAIRYKEGKLCNLSLAQTGLDEILQHLELIQKNGLSALLIKNNFTEIEVNRGEDLEEYSVSFSVWKKSSNSYYPIVVDLYIDEENLGVFLRDRLELLEFLNYISVVRTPLVMREVQSITTDILGSMESDVSSFSHHSWEEPEKEVYPPMRDGHSWEDNSWDDINAHSREQIVSIKKKLEVYLRDFPMPEDGVTFLNRDYYHWLSVNYVTIIEILKRMALLGYEISFTPDINPQKSTITFFYQESGEPDDTLEIPVYKIVEVLDSSGEADGKSLLHFCCVVADTARHSGVFTNG